MDQLELSCDAGHASSCRLLGVRSWLAGALWLSGAYDRQACALGDLVACEPPELPFCGRPALYGSNR